MPPSKKASGLETGGQRGTRKSSKESGGVSKMDRKVVVIDDSNDSDASVVSVSRSIAPSGNVRASVAKFGSVESDDEVQLQVRKSRPVNQVKSKPNAKSDGKVRTSDRNVISSSDVEDEAEVSDTGLSVASTEPYLVVDKKRRSAVDDNDSPSKIRVKDLTLSPRKMPASSSISVDKNGGRVGEGTPSRRTSGRVRKPTARAVEAGDEGSVLSQQLDEDRSDAEDSSPIKSEGSVYTPPSSRVRASGRSQKGKVVPLASLRNGAASATQDVVMGSPTVSDYDPFAAENEFRALSRSEDELPSPSTAMSRKSIVKGSVASRVAGASGSGVAGESKVERSANREAGASIKTKPLGSARATRSSTAVGTESAIAVADWARRGRHDNNNSNSGSPLVFSGAVALPEEDDSLGSGEDDEGGQEDDVVMEPLLDVGRIHPDLVDLYRSMPWIDGLRRSKFVGYPTALTETAFDDFTLASYGGLVGTAGPRVKSKLVRSVSFIRYKDFRSPVRVPLTGYVRTWECVRIPRPEGARNAAFVLSGVCLQSHVSQGREVGPSFVKQLHIRPLENDWDILQCNFGTFFNDAELHAPGRRNALVFQTKREGWTPKQFDDDKFASTPYSSPVKGASGSNVVKRDEEVASTQDVDVAKVNILQKGAPAYRHFDEGIPLYDGRTKVGSKGFKFEPADWDRYTELPLYPFPEVEANSLTTVVFTLTGFRGSTNIHNTVHFNALFAIVLGKLEG
ncbi:hypothetical protein VNI00_018915 [Paramarasmius palmivorus]|uniref:Uncharacterized protein n=1 Tax=Paramarasmius palmivorus TaxID=297713 RepID=A0AAW0ATD4_9AGAR